MKEQCYLNDLTNIQSWHGFEKGIRQFILSRRGVIGGEHEFIQITLSEVAAV